MGGPASPGGGNDVDTYVDDLAEVIDSLDLKDAVLVGHSTGGGVVARYIGRHGTKRVAKAALIKKRQCGVRGRRIDRLRPQRRAAL